MTTMNTTDAVHDSTLKASWLVTVELFRWIDAPVAPVHSAAITHISSLVLRTLTPKQRAPSSESPGRLHGQTASGAQDEHHDQRRADGETQRCPVDEVPPALQGVAGERVLHRQRLHVARAQRLDAQRRQSEHLGDHPGADPEVTALQPEGEQRDRVGQRGHEHPGQHDGDEWVDVVPLAQHEQRVRGDAHGPLLAHRHQAGVPGQQFPHLGQGEVVEDLHQRELRAVLPHSGNSAKNTVATMTAPSRPSTPSTCGPRGTVPVRSSRPAGLCPAPLHESTPPEAKLPAGTPPILTNVARTLHRPLPPALTRPRGRTRRTNRNTRWPASRSHPIQA